MSTLLINKGAAVDAKNENGETPLHLACYNGHVGVGSLLLTKSALADAKSNTGETTKILKRKGIDSVNFLAVVRLPHCPTHYNQKKNLYLQVAVKKLRLLTGSSTMWKLS